jgi:hypothetical protein
LAAPSLNCEGSGGEAGRGIAALIVVFSHLLKAPRAIEAVDGSAGRPGDRSGRSPQQGVSVVIDFWVTVIGLGVFGFGFAVGYRLGFRSNYQTNRLISAARWIRLKDKGGAFYG